MWAGTQSTPSHPQGPQGSVKRLHSGGCWLPLHCTQERPVREMAASWSPFAGWQPKALGSAPRPCCRSHRLARGQRCVPSECLDSGMGTDVSINQRQKPLASGSGGTSAGQFLGLKRGTWSGFGTELRVRAVVSPKRQSTQVWLLSLPSPLLRTETWGQGKVSVPHPALTSGGEDSLQETVRRREGRASVIRDVGRVCLGGTALDTVLRRILSLDFRSAGKGLKPVSTWRRVAVMSLRDAGIHRD